MEYLNNEQYDCEECVHWNSDEFDFPCVECGVINDERPTYFESGEGKRSVNDNVNNPTHYTSYPKEVKDIIEFVLEDSELPPFKSWCLGNELKYRLRAGLKDKDKLVEDMEKAEVFRKWRSK